MTTTAKIGDATAMVSVKYQLFLLDPKAEKQDMLLAVMPPFSAPSAIDVIMKTLKFEGKVPFIVVGLDEALEAFVKEVERRDSVDWADLELDARKQALSDLAKELAMEGKDSLRGEGEADSQVLGDEDEDEEVTAKTKLKYPIDLPPNNRDLWDAVGKSPDFKIGWDIVKRRMKSSVTGKAPAYPIDLPVENRKLWDQAWKTEKGKEDLKILKKSGNKSEELFTAVYRNFYEAYAIALGKVPWTNSTKTQITDQRIGIKGLIEQGEVDATTITNKLEKHLTHAGLVKKVGGRKFGGVSRNPQSNMFLLSHKLPWALDPLKHSWLQVVSFIKREFSTEKGGAFNHNRNKMCLRIASQVPTEIELVRVDESKIEVLIHHYLTEHQASVLTQEVTHERVTKKMNEYGKYWYRTGVFPKIDAEDYGGGLPISKSGTLK